MIELYHASGEVVEFPEVRKAKYTKDFSWGFYCTSYYEQAKKWAFRHEGKIVNVYNYEENLDLKIKKFDCVDDEWLDFVVSCRAGNVHDFDIVEGPMADDTIWNYIGDYIDKKIDKEQFFMLMKFKHPTHQISFHTLKALDCLKFERSIQIDE